MSHTTLRTVPPQAKTQALAPGLPRPRSGRVRLVRPTGSVLYLPEKLRMKLTHLWTYSNYLENSPDLLHNDEKNAAISTAVSGSEFAGGIWGYQG